LDIEFKILWNHLSKCVFQKAELWQRRTIIFSITVYVLIQTVKQLKIKRKGWGFVPVW